MNPIDGLGYFAASLVLATFCARSMPALRGLAIASNLAFITYAAAAHLWPILLLHSVMLPLNAVRLRDALAAAPPLPAASAPQSATDDASLVSLQRRSASFETPAVAGSSG